ncbi:heparinase II/III family protein [Natronosalvus rutilus]|uniref:Heparinase II/III family protein n=1 Tax=Natronosalvus rutilus TaxID=2953753 RepID=A0A9E7N7T5_9EURY|nr:heparinase II/III family protein [Natronosalvus rutilus]UTF52476.1 heparinase II/III family protein [Natronosalvus rutilus]
MSQRKQREREREECPPETDNDHQWGIDHLSAVRNPPTNLDLSRRSVLTATGAGLLAGLVPAGTTTAAEDDERYHHKTRPTMWTETMRENARRNIERYNWAAGQRDNAVESADSYLEKYGPDLDSLWSLVTSQQVPRGGGLSNERLILGGDSEPGTDRLWKIETTVDDPHGDGKLTVPTNDFGAYRESGLNDQGMFDPDLADDSLLVNEEHPEMGEGWGVDDGWGWVDENDDLGMGEGNRWNFVAYYNHWFVWRPGGVRRILDALVDAYLLTEESKYAVAGLVLMDRIADVYPEMTIADYQQNAHGFWNSHGGRQTGRIIGSHWEGNLARRLLVAYDAFFPALDDPSVADDVVSFLDGKTGEYPGLAAKDSVARIRENIEENYIKEIFPAAKASQIAPGRGQLSALAISARVLDDTRENGYTREAIEWIFQPGNEYFDGDVWNEEPENWYTTGGNVLAPIVDQCDRDGYWHEGSLGYNRIRMSSILQVAQNLQGYDGFDGADLYQHPKFQSALKINSDLLLLDEFSPTLGDTHHPAGNEMSQSGISDGYEVTGDSRFAQLWHYSNGYSTAGIRGSIYDAEPEGLAEEIQSIVDAEGPLDLPSQNLAGFGFAALRDGENYTTESYGKTYDTSDLFAEASAPINDSFDEAIQFEASQAGEWWTFEFDVADADEYELELEALFVSTYGIYDLSVNGEYVDTIDFMTDGSGRDTISYLLELPAGTNTMRFECVGKNDDSGGYKMALYYLTLLDEEARERRDAAELGNAKRAFWMYYGRNGIGGGGTPHAHRDTLQIGVAAHEMELSRDLGYPEATGSYPPRQFFTDNTISHNTVVVNERGQDHHWVGTPRHFEGEDERVNLIDVEAPHVYEETDEYRRTTATITVDEEHSYAVDFFRVAGGDDHRYSFHTTKADLTTEGLDLEPQNGGTLAGENVAYADSSYNSARSPDSRGSGLNYFDQVERDDDPADRVVLDWDVEDHFNRRDDDADGVHLRLTSFGDFDDVELANGYPPNSSGGATPEDSLRYAFLNRRGSDLETTYTSVIEHFDGDRVVDSLEEVPVSGGPGHAVRVELTNGRTDYVVCAFEKTDTLTVDDTFEFKGFFGLYSVEDGESDYAYVQDGTRLEPLDESPLIQEAEGFLRGTVEDFTREMSLENDLTIRVAADSGLLERHTGFVYVDNDQRDPWRGEPDPENPVLGRDQRGRGNGSYPIEALEDGRGNLLTVDVGEKTFTRDFVDPDQLEDGGYNYIIEEGDDVRIPLASAWSQE